MQGFPWISITVLYRKESKWSPQNLKEPMPLEPMEPMEPIEHVLWEQNHEMKRLLGEKLEEFRFYKRNIQKAIITLTIYSFVPKAQLI